MNKPRFSDKLKGGVTVHELEEFVKTHTTQVFSGLALVIGAVSSMFDFFTGPALTVFFILLGTGGGMFFPAPAEKGLKMLYSFLLKQEKTTEMILGGVLIVLAIFVPFIYFGLVGLLAGTSFHYYIRHAQTVAESKPSRSRRNDSGEEHD